MNETLPLVNEPSIFNDVLGPVMRGPSSSHTAASCRIGRMLRDLAGTDIKRALFEFHPGGSLATTHETQGSDLGLATGLLGMEILDETMPRALLMARESGIILDFEVTAYHALHPNTYKCTLWNTDNEKITAVAISTGGGMIEFREIMGFPVRLAGDFTVLFALLPEVFAHDPTQLQKCLDQIPDIVSRQVIAREGQFALVLTFGSKKTNNEIIDFAESVALWYRVLHPVMPIPGFTGGSLPFSGLIDFYSVPGYNQLPAGPYAVRYESVRSGLDEAELNRIMGKLVKTWRSSIQEGLRGTSYDDRIAGSQSPGFLRSLEQGRLIPAGPLNRMIAYSSALMEVKSSMGVIIAAPTAGSCGGLPGCLIGLADELQLSDEILIRGFWAAGLAGLFIARGATFAAEVAGCQAETGAGAAMAAAGLVEMFGGTAQQAMDAASLALQNIIGLVCDPVANRVEIPCLGRNAAAAGNALVSANMVLGGFDAVIPFDQSIQTMLEVGKSMPHSLRCTALGGLAVTPAAKLLETKLKK